MTFNTIRKHSKIKIKYSHRSFWIFLPLVSSYCPVLILSTSKKKKERNTIYLKNKYHNLNIVEVNKSQMSNIFKTMEIPVKQALWSRY